MNLGRPKPVPVLEIELKTLNYPHQKQRRRLCSRLLCFIQTPSALLDRYRPFVSRVVIKRDNQHILAVRAGFKDVIAATPKRTEPNLKTVSVALNPLRPKRLQ
jgi:hypothetical protein